MRVKEKVRLAFGSIEGTEDGMPVGSAVTLGEGERGGSAHSRGGSPSKPRLHSGAQ